jgi:hypothetical protein
MEGRVLVVDPEIVPSGIPGRYFARIVPLGLGASGATPEEAARKLLAMFAGAVRRRRIAGRLAAWLDRSGVDWHWYSDEDRLKPVINADYELNVQPDVRHWRLMAA